MTVIKIDLLSSLGRQVAGQYGVDVIPALLLFDGEGQLMIRQKGLIDAHQIRDIVLAEDNP